MRKSWLFGVRQQAGLQKQDSGDHRALLSQSNLEGMLVDQSYITGKITRQTAWHRHAHGPHKQLTCELRVSSFVCINYNAQVDARGVLIMPKRWSLLIQVLYSTAHSVSVYHFFSPL